MKKTSFLVSITFLLALSFVSCNKKDDGVTFVPARDRGEEAPVSTAIIEEYLETHFYNYEEFENPPVGFDNKVKFDTIAGENSNKTPLIEQVSSKTVPDRIADGVSYTLYYLPVVEGGGKKPKFPDIATVTYEGYFLNTEFSNSPYFDLFDSAATPVSFDLTAVVNGFQDAMIEFKTSPTGPEIGNDGSLTYTNFGIGAVFIPSGLAYYVNPPSGSAIPFYSQLIFTFQLYASRQGDQDGDGIPTFLEDLNNNKLEEDDDTDGDGLPNFFDADDDNDGRPTIQEVIIREYVLEEGDPEPALGAKEFEINRIYDDATMQTTIKTLEYKDANNNGIADYRENDI